MFRLELSEKTRLERFEEAHAEELFTLTDANRSHLREWLPWLDLIRSVEDTRAFILRSLAQDAKGRGFHCGIWHEKRLVGVIGYHEVVHLFVMGGLFFHWVFVRQLASEAADRETALAETGARALTV